MNAYDRTRVHADLLGHPFRFATAHGLFSADRVDDGTRLLLEHLPPGEPRSVLDLGCGYGALGLPVAARHPDASVLLADRDLLAVEYSKRNAAEHGLANAAARGSLGLRDAGPGPFDWVLCNVPARIGAPAVAYILRAGAARLREGGSLRVVVLHALAESVESAGLGATAVARGARHVVYEVGPRRQEPEDHEAIYRHDEVTVDGRVLERPADMSEDPSHLRDALPLLTTCLPRTPRGPALVWRGGYGAVALALAAAGGHVEAADRDLLATTFTRRNAARAGLSVSTREAPFLDSALGEAETFAHIVGETPLAAGDAAAASEMACVRANLAPGGEALWLAHGRVPAGAPPRIAVLASRGGWSVLRLRR